MEQQDSRIVLNRQQLRQTILISRLTQLWNQNKLLYILLLLGIFLIAIATILYVLNYVVVPSSRYSFLEKTQALKLQKQLGLKKAQNSILNQNLLPPIFPGVPAPSGEHQPPQHQIPQGKTSVQSSGSNSNGSSSKSTHQQNKNKNSQKSQNNHQKQNSNKNDHQKQNSNKNDHKDKKHHKHHKHNG